jgi:glycosyltransferase involved in cell wall biosynthesis
MAEGESHGAAAPPSVLHINTERTWRGGESQAFYLMSGLRALGGRVGVAALPGSALAARCREAGMHVFEVGMAADLDIGGASRIARHAEGNGFQILHAHTARAHAMGLLARTLGSKAKLVVHRRLDFPVSTGLAGRLKYRSAKVDLYLAVAEVIRRMLIEAGVRAEKVRVVNSSIDIGRFREARERRSEIGADVRRELGLPASSIVVGNVAHLAGHKSQRDLIAAMPRLLADLPGARLVVVGDGEERARLAAQASALGVAESVVFTGFRKDVPRLLAAFDLFAMSSRLEGFCNSVLEAFAAGVPDVATRAGGLPEMVRDGETGLLTPVGDPAALASALLRLAGDRPLAERLAVAGRKLVESEYTVERMVERTALAYADLIRGV